jgi:hypothetical protein
MLLPLVVKGSHEKASELSAIEPDESSEKEVEHPSTAEEGEHMRKLAHSSSG